MPKSGRSLGLPEKHPIVEDRKRIGEALQSSYTWRSLVGKRREEELQRTELHEEQIATQSASLFEAALAWCFPRCASLLRVPTERVLRVTESEDR